MTTLTVIIIVACLVLLISLPKFGHWFDDFRSERSGIKIEIRRSSTPEDERKWKRHLLQFYLHQIPFFGRFI